MKFIMRKKDMQEEIARLRNVVMDQGRAITGLMLECERLRGERDKAVEDISMLGRTGEFICPVCAHYNHGEGTKECVKCLTRDGFRWRGEKEEGASE